MAGVGFGGIDLFFGFRFFVDGFETEGEARRCGMTVERRNRFPG
jgi:hypothetical protein